MMLRKLPVPLFVVKTGAIRPGILTSTYSLQSRYYHNPLKSVAVLGGGISGLSTAWYLTKFAPGVPVTLYEKSPRLGGWLSSKLVEYDGGQVLFEQGPRTLRQSSTNGLVTIDMVRRLGLTKSISLPVDPSPTRWIFYPDGFNRVPDTVTGFFRSLRIPIMRSVPSSILFEPFRKRRSLELEDESVGSFISRRFSHLIAQNLVSAMIHGVYAGDVDKLSVKSLFPAAWRHEELHGSVVRGLLFKKKQERLSDLQLRAELWMDNAEIMKKISHTTMYSFRGGIETLSRALAVELKKNPNVTIKMSKEIPPASIAYDATKNPMRPFTVAEKLYSHVISTLYAPHSNKLLPVQYQIPELSTIPVVTVLVVNLFYRSLYLVPILKGFGYVIPKSVSIGINPHRALGVIFDTPSTRDSETGTKLTVMLGGHFYDSMPLPRSQSDAIEMAKEVVKYQLGVHVPPAATAVALQRDCIPQYHVGHEARLSEAHKSLERMFDGRLAVAGNSYRGVGLNDCVRNARDVVLGFVKNGGATGLEEMGLDNWVDSTAVYIPQ